MEKDENTQKKKNETGNSFFDGKGFYIVLSVCAVVIAVSAGMLIWGGTGAGTHVESAKPLSEYNSASAPGLTPADADLNPDGSQDGKADTAPADASPQSGTDEAPEPASSGGPQDFNEAVATMSIPSPEDESRETSGGALKMIWPLAGNIEVGYSGDELVYNKTMMDWRTHGGVDIAAPIGSKVMAVADGTVSEVRDDDLFGTTVVIDHGDGLMSVYSNLAKTPTVSVGDTVAMGAVIGAVGDTAIAESGEVTHLHFAMLQDGKSVDPVDLLPKKS